MSKREQWNERYSSKELIWSAGPNALFYEEVKDLKPGKSIDIACGEGRNAIWLAEQGWDSTGIDFSEVGIDKARQIGEKRKVSVKWIANDVSNTPLEEEAYDLVAVLYLHTSLEERRKWLPNVLKAVKPSGTFIYIGHDPSNIEEGVGGPQDIALLPGVSEFTDAMPDFDISSATVLNRPVVNDPGHGKELSGVALDAFVRATKVSS